MFLDQWVLITGPTTGIGRDLAVLFAQEKSNLILVSRNLGKLKSLKSELEDTYQVRCEVIVSDLAQAHSAAKLVQAVAARQLTVDVLVNNAGYGVYGLFHKESLESQLGMIELHITSLTYLTHAFLPHMIKAKRGGVLNVASTGGFQAVPIENVYCATKAYVVHFTEALAEELDGSEVKITCLCPGPTETPFFAQPLMKSWTPGKLSRMKSMDVARLGLKAFKAGKPLEITGGFNRFMILASKLAPRQVVTRAAKKVILKRNIPI